MEMLARCVATLKPPPELTLSQWADRYRMLSAESSAEPGRWHTDKAPYQREIMDAIGDAHIRRVVIMCAAQLGKTELLLNILGYFMAYAPAPILVMQPTLDMGQTFSKDRLAPMIRDTPVLRGLVDVKSRYAGNTILKKNFPGGHITIVGANSATGLASRPIKVLLADEVDRYPGSAGTEGDPLSLAQKRQTTFWDKKTVMVSTPVIKGHSRIETEYNQSTREEWNVPCPECGHYQPFVWANLIFDPDDLQKEIVYKCERCGCVANEYRWKQQSQQGRFVAENPGAETRGFHLNTLASTFCGWKEIVQKFIVAKEQLDQGNPEGMKVWVNTELGETWEERGEQVEDTELFNRREIYDAVVPEEVLVLTAGVDVQDDRFEVEIVGWGVGKESWGIRYQKIYGDMLKEQVWEDLDAFLQTVWCKKDGTALRIISCCIDSGGHHTDQVYRFTKERYERGVWAIKGKGGAEVPYIRNPTTNNRVKTPLFIIAEEKYQAHLREKGPDLKIGNDHELANYIETTILDKDCSPAAVLGFAMIEGKKFKTSLSVPTIYKYIAKGLFLNLTQEELPRHGKKKHKYKKVKKNKSASRAPAGESIEQRPEEIDGREEFGHWEGDTVYSGKGKRKTTRALLTLTERKTRKEIIIAIPNRKAETVVKALDALERKLGARRFRAIFKSITFDNGTEFAAAEELERSCINKHMPRTKVYFCHPYSSWERGTNENTNGMIRRRFPKGTNFAAVTNAQIVQAESWINNYPRKILGYKSSEIVFRECLRELGIAA